MSNDNKRSKRKSKKSQKRSSTTINYEILSPSELNSLTINNSFLLNSAIPNALFQSDIVFSVERRESTKYLHNYLFDPKVIKELDHDKLISLYGIAVNDLNKSRMANMKLAETSEKSRWFKDLTKVMSDMAKQQAEAEAVQQGKSNTNELVVSLINESMRLALEDELIQKYGGSNTYKPLENKEYEVISIDPDSDED